MSTPYPRDSHMTSIAIAYKNDEISLIADEVLPRVPVGKKLFKWTEFDLADGYQIPDTSMGKKGEAGESELSGVERTSTTNDYGHKTRVWNEDIKEAPAGFDPKDQAVEFCTNVVQLDREVRTAKMVFDAALYDAANKVNLAGGGGEVQWSDFNNSDPIAYIRTKLDAMLIRPNRMVFGQAVWSKISLHPAVISSMLGNSGTKGVATEDAVAKLLGLQKVLVGAPLFNTAKPGKTAVLQAAWGKHALAFFSSKAAQTKGMTYGFTAQYGNRIAGAKAIEAGVDGAISIRVAESVREVISAKGAAFLFQNAVA